MASFVRNKYYKENYRKKVLKKHGSCKNYAFRMFGWLYVCSNKRRIEFDVNVIFNSIQYCASLQTYQSIVIAIVGLYQSTPTLLIEFSSSGIICDSCYLSLSLFIHVSVYIYIYIYMFACE